MPVPLLAQLLSQGPGSIPYVHTIPKIACYAGGLYLVRRYFAGAKNVSERNMHSKVVLMTVWFQSNSRNEKSLTSIAIFS